MKESSEFIGTMPSAPASQLPLQTTKPNNMLMAIGFALWGLCLLIFPWYANLDQLSTGVFSSMGFALLFLVAIASFSWLRRRKRTQPFQPSQQQKNTRNVRGVIILLLLALCLLILPKYTNINALFAGVCYGFGLIWLLLGVIVLITSANKQRSLAEAELKVGK